MIPHSIQKHIDQSPDKQNYNNHKHHVFIITDAGRPVYTRYGDETELSSLIATMGAILEKYKIYFFKDGNAGFFKYLNDFYINRYSKQKITIKTQL
ncbi:hypothetical protein IMG5_017110 [Ichthyophthirius multifiliis]|uniref:FUZ/MON1/HPS1 first Longin domain-containing protein n=1 Tax=Ichthyophthirius multifiliis TaxID=5932 RepID=G0QKF1_ICHMU|nr:hypothetical protein IMG5_017110 [Ichthyophthirius multifiliis]EGR34304.1 hypothetical protein IMG5_017110 [Ichthyophthirius multifiliis]|eukprot:XP_004039608.1 hypothetical protein IMG5_017110 [Ichthyophthirius multifiliis]